MEWQLVQTMSRWVCSLRRIVGAREGLACGQRRRHPEPFRRGLGNATGIVAFPRPRLRVPGRGRAALTAGVFGLSRPSADAFVMGIRKKGA